LRSAVADDADVNVGLEIVGRMGRIIEGKVVIFLIVTVWGSDVLGKTT
jgi:hypothetical protein